MATQQPTAMRLDEQALERVKTGIEDGAVTPSIDEYAQDICNLLNGALATELVCVLRYKRHHFTARGLASPAIAAEFLEHANEEAAHGDRIAARIVQLGGDPEFDPAKLLELSHADYDASKDLVAMIKANLIAERVAVESYRQMINLIGDKDPTTVRMLEAILADEEQHADEMADLLGR
jgi:bacterioferritin